MSLKVKNAFKPFLHPVVAPVLTAVLCCTVCYFHWWKVHAYPPRHAGPMPYISIWCARKQSDREERQRRLQQQSTQTAL